MARHNRFNLLIGLAEVGTLLVVGAGCSGEASPGPVEVGAASILMEVPRCLGEAERQPVLYDHGVHVRALGAASCKQCHAIDEQERVLARLAGLPDTDDVDEWMEFYHDTCIGCHQERKDADQDTGPVTCGECHRKRPPLRQVRLAMRFDYSLHARHVQAAGGRCEACHHVYDESKQALVYREGAESACRDCHLDEPGGPTGEAPSLRTASHLTCINCHRDQTGEREDPMPLGCLGCHSPKARAAIEKLPPEELPRLMRGQPDITWIRAEGASSNLVPFNHAFHETQTQACSDCHHQTLKACSSCHTLKAGEAGGGVNLEQAYHDPDSRHSCVGCHRLQTDRAACAGCHHDLPAPPGDAGCKACHAGPLPARADEVDPATLLGRITPQPLPEASAEAFPASITIDTVSNRLGVTPGNDYGPARFPHRAIAEHLHGIVSDSRLALRAHQGSQTLCAGCHHHTPPGSRPPACVTCHGDRAGRTDDMPDLITAFHRQCAGCHQQMKIGLQGCTDCHDAVAKEGQR